MKNLISKIFPGGNKESPPQADGVFGCLSNILHLRRKRRGIKPRLRNKKPSELLDPHRQTDDKDLIILTSLEDRITYSIPLRELIKYLEQRLFN